MAIDRLRLVTNIDGKGHKIGMLADDLLQPPVVGKLAGVFPQLDLDAGAPVGLVRRYQGVAVATI